MNGRPIKSRINTDQLKSCGLADALRDSCDLGRLIHISSANNECGRGFWNFFRNYFIANAPGELARAENFGADILRLCVAVGGVLTGEHGVGVEKRDLMPEMFNDIDLAQQINVKCAFDAKQLLNPGKVFPTLHRCAELGQMHVHGGQLRFPDIPRF